MGSVTRFTLIWHEAGREVGREELHAYGRAVVQTYAQDRLRQHPARSFRIEQQAAAPLAGAA